LWLLPSLLLGLLAGRPTVPFTFLDLRLRLRLVLRVLSHDGVSRLMAVIPVVKPLLMLRSGVPIP